MFKSWISALAHALLLVLWSFVAQAQTNPSLTLAVSDNLTPTAHSFLSLLTLRAKSDYSLELKLETVNSRAAVAILEKASTDLVLLDCAQLMESHPEQSLICKTVRTPFLFNNSRTIFNFQSSDTAKLVLATMARKGFLGLAYAAFEPTYLVGPGKFPGIAALLKTRIAVRDNASVRTLGRDLFQAELAPIIPRETDKMTDFKGFGAAEIGHHEIREVSR